MSDLIPESKINNQITGQFSFSLPNRNNQIASDDLDHTNNEQYNNEVKTKYTDRFKSSHSFQSTLPPSYCMSTFSSHLFTNFSDKQTNPGLLTNIDQDLDEVSVNYMNKRYDGNSAIAGSNKISSIRNKTTHNKTDSRFCEESLETRIQKLLRLNNSDSDLLDCSKTSDDFIKSQNLSKFSEFSVDNLPPKIVENQKSHKISQEIAIDHNTPKSSCSHIDVSQNHQILKKLSPSSSNRRTLLPTPESTDEKQKLQLHTLYRPPLLKTPMKAVDMHEISKIIHHVHDVFLEELREIIQRDLMRRLIEGQAYKLFSDWWDTQDADYKVHN